MESQYFYHHDNVLVTCYLVDGGEFLPGVDFVITEIQTSRNGRGLGHASAVLKTVCQQADIEQVTLALDVQPDGSPKSLNYDQLIEWYRRHHFKFIGKKGYGFMVRKPGKPVPSLPAIQLPG